MPQNNLASTASAVAFCGWKLYSAESVGHVRAFTRPPVARGLHFSDDYKPAEPNTYMALLGARGTLPVERLSIHRKSAWQSRAGFKQDVELGKEAEGRRCCGSGEIYHQVNFIWPICLFHRAIVSSIRQTYRFLLVFVILIVITCYAPYEGICRPAYSRVMRPDASA
jgi:hypothetical protein